MSSDEFTHWVAYAGMEPFGYPMENYRMGVPTSALMGAIFATIPKAKGARRPKPPAPHEFYPQHKKREPELTKEQRDHIRNKRKTSPKKQPPKRK